MKLKLVYIVSNVDRWIAMEWITEELKKSKFEIRFILLNSGFSHLEEYLQNFNFEYIRIAYKQKRNLPKAIWQTYKILKKWKPDLVHTHFIDASLVGLTASKMAGIKRRIHTRHHSTFHHNYARKGVLIDKFVNWLSTDIIAITQLVAEILMEKERVASEKITIIHHGFKLNEFINPSENKVLSLKEKYQIKNNHMIIGVVARHIHLKGVQYIVKAFQKLMNQYPGCILFLANARGNYSHEIYSLLKDVPQNRYRLVPFEKEVGAMFKLFDLYVHTPIDPQIEAYGQTYVEALAAGLPSVYTLSGIAHDFIENMKNAIVVPYRNSEEIANSLRFLLDNQEEARKLACQGQQDVIKLFDLQRMIDGLEALYLRNVVNSKKPIQAF